MGRTTTPTYRLVMRVPGFAYSAQAWDCKHAGLPTDENLARDVRAFEASTAFDGCNAHLGRQVVASAKVVRQATGEVVATYQQPMFAGGLVTTIELYRDAEAHEVWRIRRGDGSVIAEGIASDDDMKWIRAAEDRAERREVRR